jgi:hypothetical protein
MNWRRFSILPLFIAAFVSLGAVLQGIDLTSTNPWVSTTTAHGVMIGQGTQVALTQVGPCAAPQAIAYVNGSSADPTCTSMQQTLGYAAGRYYSLSAGALTTLALSADTVYYMPISVGEKHTFDRIAVQVTTTGTANNVRMAIYNNVNGVPTSLVIDAGALAISGTGLKASTISQSLNAGVYFLAIVADGSVTVSATPNSQTNYWRWVGTTDFVTADTMLSGSLTFGAFPGTAGAVSYSASAIPVLGVRG